MIFPFFQVPGQFSGSPHLTLDFFLWGTLKNIVYISSETLRERFNAIDCRNVRWNRFRNVIRDSVGGSEIIKLYRCMQFILIVKISFVNKNRQNQILKSVRFRILIIKILIINIFM